MPPLADTHVHLLAGLDDGPPDREVALAMCRMLTAEGAGHAAAVAHQNADYPDNTADRLRAAAADLAADLAADGVPLAVYPTGEVMLSPTTLDDWRAGRLLTVGDRGRWLLVEMPHGEFVDVRPFADALRPSGVGLVVAHAERYPDLLYNPGLAADWVAAGCLIQVTARALADPPNPLAEQALRGWARGGFVHLLGSDGHGIDRRRPRLADGYRRLAEWAGRAAADRVGAEWGAAVLQGLPVAVPPPAPPPRSWFRRLFGG
ncbi:MAG: protein tyrosine phosphatase [Isosphaera sp.]|nr:protein tyrosine phosphatase [Isosphaera sp.]